MLLNYTIQYKLPACVQVLQMRVENSHSLFTFYPFTELTTEFRALFLRKKKKPLDSSHFRQHLKAAAAKRHETRERDRRATRGERERDIQRE